MSRAGQQHGVGTVSPDLRIAFVGPLQEPTSIRCRYFVSGLGLDGSDEHQVCGDDVGLRPRAGQDLGIDKAGKEFAPPWSSQADPLAGAGPPGDPG